MRRLSLNLVAIALLAPPLILACDPANSEEKQMRAKIAGDYVLEMSGSDRTMREVLSLRPDSRWMRVITLSNPYPSPASVMTDSGNYRIQGVTINLHSEVHPDVTTRYIVSGDSLFWAEAAQAHALTGYDVGERIMVRER